MMVILNSLISSMSNPASQELDRFIQETQKVCYMLNGKKNNGGFGVIWTGTRCNDNLPVAVKVISSYKIPEWAKVNIDLYLFIAC